MTDKLIEIVQAKVFEALLAAVGVDAIREYAERAQARDKLAASTTQKILSSLEQAGMAVVQGWQPIETVPKDGLSVWVGAVGPYGLWGMEPCRARSAREWQNIYTCQMIDWTPTYWTPLPLTPTQGKHDG